MYIYIHIILHVWHIYLWSFRRPVSYAGCADGGASQQVGLWEGQPPAVANTFGAEIPDHFGRFEPQEFCSFWQIVWWNTKNQETYRNGIYIYMWFHEAFHVGNSRTVICSGAQSHILLIFSTFWLLESPPCIPILVWCSKSYILESGCLLVESQFLLM